LAATVTRKDGHDPIIFLQCGPIRYRVDAKKQAASRPFSQRVVLRRTAFHSARLAAGTASSIQGLYALMAQDEKRNAMIFEDCSPRWRRDARRSSSRNASDHLQAIAERLSKFATSSS
jgi:hypothetical protein